MNCFRYYDYFIYLQFKKKWRSPAGTQLPVFLFVCVFPLIAAVILWVPIGAFGLEVQLGFLMLYITAAHIFYLVLCFFIRRVFRPKRQDESCE